MLFRTNQVGNGGFRRTFDDPENQASRQGPTAVVEDRQPVAKRYCTPQMACARGAHARCGLLITENPAEPRQYGEVSSASLAYTMPLHHPRPHSRDVGLIATKT